MLNIVFFTDEQENKLSSPGSLTAYTGLQVQNTDPVFSVLYGGNAQRFRNEDFCG